MALTELQLPSKSSFYNKLQLAASEMDQIRTDLVDFRTVMEEVVQFYEGTATTATKAPNAIVDKIRKM